MSVNHQHPHQRISPPYILQQESFPRQVVPPTPDSCESPTEKVDGCKTDTCVPKSSAASVHSLDDFPDGGMRAWLVVFGSLCSTFSTFGYVNSWGTFQAYYQVTILKDATPSQLAWIGSIQYSLIFLPGIFVGRLFDLGYFKIPYACCSVILVGATFLIPECRSYWQFLLCQGVAVGLACGGIFSPTTAVVAHWFKERRNFALGLTTIGASISGTTLPILIKNLLPVVGFAWTMRIIGFILIVTLTLGNLTVKRRLPPSNLAGGLFNFAAFKNMAYTTYCASAFIMYLGFYTTLTFIDTSALSYGISANFAFYLVAISNASSGVGRLLGGLVADRFGSMNVMIPLTVIAGIITMAWPYARAPGSLAVIAVIYGITSGSYVALLMNPMVPMGRTGDIGRRVGMFMTILGIGALCGPPISGVILRRSVGFTAVGFYAGSMILVGTVLLVITRHLVLKKWWGKF